MPSSGVAGCSGAASRSVASGRIGSSPTSELRVEVTPWPDPGPARPPEEGPDDGEDQRRDRDDREDRHEEHAVSGPPAAPAFQIATREEPQERRAIDQQPCQDVLETVP